MKNAIHLLCRSEPSRGNTRSIICQRCAWLGLLLAGCCVVLTSLAHPAQAAVTEAWVQRYNSSGRAVVVDGSGNVVVTGDSATIKYLADGTGVWTNNTGATALAVDGSGNVVVAGSSADDYYTARFEAADGALLWEKRYNGPANSFDEASAVAVDASGNVVVTGSSRSSGEGNSSDYYTAKYAAADGTLLWETRYNSPANGADYAHRVAVDRSGNVVVLGYSDFYLYHADYYAAKYAAADGELLWEQRYNGPRGLLFDVSMSQMVAVAVDGSGNVVVAGSSADNYYTAKFAAADGALLWEKRYNGPANSSGYASAVGVDSSGNVVVTGNSWNGTNADYYTAKYAAADGVLLWEKRYNGPANSYDSAWALAMDSSGNVLVTGSSYAGIFHTDSDYYMAKYAAADGALLWEKRYNAPVTGDSVSSLALGPNGMFAITGTSSGDYATVVYWENLPPVSIALVPTGVRLRLPGVPGRSYTIERALAVTGRWSTINTQTAPASGLLEYLDATPLPGSAFYRTVTP